MSKVFIDPMISVLKLDGGETGNVTGKGRGLGTPSDSVTNYPDGFVDFAWWQANINSNWKDYVDYMIELGCEDEINWEEEPNNP